MDEKHQRETIVNNLKFLRKLYNETQRETAAVINISEGTYSDYINMKKMPSREIISKIAKHYNISEYELINTDLSKDSSDFEYDDLKDFIKKITNNPELLFPIIEISNLENDIIFKEAIKLHKKMYADITNMKNDFELLFKKYEESYKKFKNLDSCANELILLLMLKSGNTTDSSFAGVYNPLEDSDLDIIIKDCILINYDENNKISNTINTDLNQIEIFNKKIDEIINILNKNNEYREFLEYYLVLEYLLGVGNINLDKGLNIFISMEMERCLERLNNKYLMNLINIFY